MVHIKIRLSIVFLVLIGSTIRPAFGQIPNFVLPASLYRPPSYAATDFALMEILLKDFVKNKYITGITENDSRGSQIVLDRKGFEGFQPTDLNILVGDLNDVSTEATRAQKAAGQEALFELSNGYWRRAFGKIYPHCKACVYAEHPTYGNDGTALIKFRIGPGDMIHGMAFGTYQFIRRKASWAIRKRSIQHLQ